KVAAATIQAAAPAPAAFAVPPAPNAAMLASSASETLDSRDAPTASDLSAMAASPMGAGAEGGELARARAIAQRLGITNLTDDEYDVPTYMRRQKEREF